MSKKVIILGSGGHGWQIFENYLAESLEDQVKIYGLTVDYGGSGGIWYRLLEYDDYTLSRKLFGEVKPILPWGDFNKIIIHCISRLYGSVVAKTLDFRSFDLDSHIRAFHILADYMALEKSICDHFEDFFTTSLEYFKENQDDLEYDPGKEFCLGYPWQDFVFWNLGGVADVNLFYKKKHVFPQNLKISFTADNRQILVAKNAKSQEFFGEDEVDHSQHPILPDSLKILDLNKDLAKPKDFLINDLEQVDLIIIPTGSIANWLPLINQSKIAQIIEKKSQLNKVFWFLNLKKNENEFGLETYLDYLLSKNIKPNLVTANPEENLENLDHNLFSQDLLNLIKQQNLEFHTKLKVINGWKYDPVSVRSFMKEI